METNELLTADELAQKLKVTAATVANWRHRGVIPSIQINASTIRYSFPDVLAAIRSKAASKTAAGAPVASGA